MNAKNDQLLCHEFLTLSEMFENLQLLPRPAGREMRERRQKWSKNKLDAMSNKAKVAVQFGNIMFISNIQGA